MHIIYALTKMDLFESVHKAGIARENIYEQLLPLVVPIHARKACPCAYSHITDRFSQYIVYVQLLKMSSKQSLECEMFR